jgi:inorganic pyrophosphatase
MSVPLSTALCRGRFAANIAARCRARTGQQIMRADGDPLDITEKQILHGDILLDACPIGGLRMIDTDEADDKIIAVLRDDLVYGKMRDIADCPRAIVDRLIHLQKIARIGKPAGLHRRGLRSQRGA